MSQSRQLAAIMFTDIVGYTSLMGADEQNAIELLHKSRRFQQDLIERHGGKWIKEMGDGVLASFNTATDAVQSAILIQRYSTNIPNLQLRIGIHLGDTLFENNDIFGDGVNIASRLLAQAPAGGICVSGPVHDNVANKKGILTTFLREELLKNVKEPVRIYKVNFDLPSIAEPEMVELSSSPIITNNETIGKITEKSVAVLPFVNMSNDVEQEYFSDGITEEILNSLAHVKDLRVAGRSSSFHFKGKNIDLRKIGQKLNVQTVLEGSVRRQGSKLRITAQLINVDNGFHIWSERYDREMDDIFAIQDEIALAITEKLKITLLEKEKAKINEKPTDNHEAYDLYLKGRFYFNKRGAGILKALEYFQLALEIDPLLTLAYIGLADSYCILSLYCIVPPHTAMPKARQYAEKALQLHSAEAEAYTALAFINAFYDWNWVEAKKEFQRALTINPNYAPAHYWYSYYLSYIERNNLEAINEATKAAKLLEPLVPVSHHFLAIMYINAGRFEEGLKASKMAIELDENSYPGYRSLGYCLAGLHRYPEAIDAFKTAVVLSSRQILPLVELCWVYSLSGKIEETLEIMDELTIRAKTEYISAVFLSCVASYSKDDEKAVEYLERAFNERDTTLFGIKVSPLTSFVRSDSRFLSFLERMNYPE